MWSENHWVKWGWWTLGCPSGSHIYHFQFMMEMKAPRNSCISSPEAPLAPQRKPFGTQAAVPWAVSMGSCWWRNWTTFSSPCFPGFCTILIHVITKLLRLKAYFLPFLLVNTKCPSFSRKWQGMPKARRDMIWRNKWSIRSRLRYDTDVGIIRQGI